MNFVQVRIDLGILAWCHDCGASYDPAGGRNRLCERCEHYEWMRYQEDQQRQMEMQEEEDRYWERRRAEEEMELERQRMAIQLPDDGPRDDYERWGAAYGGDGW